MNKIVSPRLCFAIGSIGIALAGNSFAQTNASCPFTAAEVKQTLGIDVKEGVAEKEMVFTGGKRLFCRYNSAELVKPSLWVTQTVMDDANNPANANNFKFLAGKLTPVPNDPDGAGWQDNQGDNTNATLHYLRKGALVELRVTISPRDKTYADIRSKLPKMRRLP